MLDLFELKSDLGIPMSRQDLDGKVKLLHLSLPNRVVLSSAE
jgi:hypothetical protein